MNGNDLNRAEVLTDLARDTVNDMFIYHRPTDEKIEKMNEVREVLAEAVKVVIANVPPSADRSAAIRKIREARMDANSAITHDGKF